MHPSADETAGSARFREAPGEGPPTCITRLLYYRCYYIIRAPNRVDERNPSTLYKQVYFYFPPLFFRHRMYNPFELVSCYFQKKKTLLSDIVLLADDIAGCFYSRCRTAPCWLGAFFVVQMVRTLYNACRSLRLLPPPRQTEVNCSFVML